MGKRAGLTIERITMAAADLADEIGFAGLTVAGLARGFGVKDASLYSHIESLRELRTRVAMLAASELADRIADAVAGRSGKEALAAFAQAYREFALRYPGRYAATQLQLEPDRVASSPGHRRCGELTYGMLRAYHLDEPDLTDAVRLLRAAFHGYSDLEAAGGFGHPRDIASSWGQAIEALHLTLEHWPTEGRTS